MSRLPDHYTIRLACTDDIPRFSVMETAADRLYDSTDLLADTTNDDNIPVSVISDAIQSSLAHVAIGPDNEVVGFVLCSLREPDLYLDQVSVLPAHGRKGLGTALIKTVFEDARRRKLDSVSLSTFRDVAWNGPYYERLGFVEIPRNELTQWMLDLEAQQSKYLDTTKRCFMRLDV